MKLQSFANVGTGLGRFLMWGVCAMRKHELYIISGMLFEMCLTNQTLDAERLYSTDECRGGE